jgi:hypothetical protein
LQAAQAAHACFDFSVAHPEHVALWHENSNYLILLSVPDEETLLAYAHEVAEAGIAHTLVREPDIGDEATALAVAPSHFCARFSSLPLHGKEVVSA